MHLLLAGCQEPQWRLLSTLKADLPAEYGTFRPANLLADSACPKILYTFGYSPISGRWPEYSLRTATASWALKNHIWPSQLSKELSLLQAPCHGMSHSSMFSFCLRLISLQIRRGMGRVRRLLAIAESNLTVLPARQQVTEYTKVNCPLADGRVHLASSDVL